MKLFSYRICPFCAKVRAVARYRDIPVNIVEVNPLTKAQISFSKHRKVPIAVIDDDVIVESDRIVDRILGDEPVTPEARKWSRWASDDLALMMYPNLTRTPAECRAALAYADAAFPPLEALAVKWIGGWGMSLAHSKVKKKYGIVDERAALADRLRVWEDYLQARAADRLDLGDLAVFGVLGALDGTQAHADVMHHHPKIKSWFDKVDAALPPLRHYT